MKFINPYVKVDDKSEEFDGEGEPAILPSPGPPTPPKHRKNERFDRYLEKSGVTATILRGIVSLFEDEYKPNDPIRYLCQQWGFGIPKLDEVDSLQAEVIHLRQRYETLLEENEQFNLLTQPEPTSSETSGLDSATQALLLKQEAQLAQIQHREACISKALKEAKVTAAKELIKIPICLPVGEEMDDIGLHAHEPKPVAVVEEVEQLGEEESSEDQLKCESDWLLNTVPSRRGMGDHPSRDDGDTVITVQLEELKNPPRYNCSGST